MTRLFGNKRDKTTIAELEEYYANQDSKKTGSGRAWLMAFLSIVITVAVFVALFFAGRWLYRTITDNSSDTVSTSGSSDIKVDLPTFDGDIVGQGNNSNDSSNENDNSNTGSTPESESGGVVSDQAVSTTESNTRSVSGATNTSNAESIPNTGASDYILVIPFVTAVAGYFISRRNYSKQK